MLSLALGIFWCLVLCNEPTFIVGNKFERQGLLFSENIGPRYFTPQFRSENTEGHNAGKGSARENVKRNPSELANTGLSCGNKWAGFFTSSFNKFGVCASNGINRQEARSQDQVQGGLSNYIRCRGLALVYQFDIYFTGNARIFDLPPNTSKIGPHLRFASLAGNVDSSFTDISLFLACKPEAVCGHPKPPSEDGQENGTKSSDGRLVFVKNIYKPHNPPTDKIIVGAFIIIVAGIVILGALPRD